MSDIISYSRELFKNYHLYRADAFPRRNFPPDLFLKTIDGLVGISSGLISTKTAGTSFEGREMRLIEIGNGTVPVVLWSQMHGDESTATMAVCDILSYFIKMEKEKQAGKILSALKLHFLPMLNPDGAERFQRRTAQGIDMNRDALALVTPEARLLKQLQHELKPRFGFNLHDQELSTVGSSREIAAVGLLAPALDHEKTENATRARAKRMAAVFACVMNEFIPGKVTKYDDSFEPRAFGDNMQKWGTSTLLIESGHAPDDAEKNLIRKLNVTGILATLFAIATGEDKNADVSVYEKLPFNGKRAYDVIIKNVMVEYANGTKTNIDLGISYQVDTHSENPPKLIDMGDLHLFTGLREIDGKGKTLPHSLLSINQPFEWKKYF